MLRPEKVGPVLEPRRHGQRRPEVPRRFTEVLKSTPGHTNHLHRISADNDLPSDDVRPASEHGFPNVITQDHHWLAPGRRDILRQYRTAKRRSYAEHLE